MKLYKTRKKTEVTNRKTSPRNNQSYRSSASSSQKLLKLKSMKVARVDQDQPHRFSPALLYYTCYIVPHSTLFSSMNITELPPQIRSIKLIQTNRKYQVFVFSKSIWNYQQIICFFAAIGEMKEILIFLTL